MPTRTDHLDEAERLERQAEIADNAHARAALRRMAQASRGAAALVGMIEACGEEVFQSCLVDVAVRPQPGRP